MQPIFSIFRLAMMKRILLCVAAVLSILFSQAQVLSRAQAIADIDEYNKVLNEVHYNPYLYISQKAYAHKTDSLKQSIKDSLGVKALVLKISELTAALNDGHSMPAIVQPPFQPDFRKPIYFPLALTAGQKDQLLTGNNSFGIPAGAVVLSINGQSMSRFYPRAQGFFGGLPAFKKEMSARLLGNSLYYAGLLPPFKVVYSVKGKTASIALKGGITLKESLAKAFPQVGGTDYSFKIINNKVGYINLLSMGNDYQRYAKFFDSCFTAMKANHIKTLAIDLRNNSGGNAIIAHLLISYFNTKPYALSGGRYWKVSQRYKDYLIKRRDTGNLYLKQANGTIIDQRKCGAQEPMFVGNDHLFGGKVYLITGPATFSSAMQLADAAKQYHMATIIGEPTGENTNDFGETYKFDLPNSKIQIQLTTTFDLGADCDPKKSHPVMPDHFLKLTGTAMPEAMDPPIRYILKQSN